MRVQRVKYVQVAEELALRIKRGDFMPGERIYSRSELAKRYNIGELTAVRVQNHLADLGLVSKVRGCGIFANYDNTPYTPAPRNAGEHPIKRIVELRFKSGDPFSSAFFAGIEAAVERAGIEHRIEIYKRNQVSLQSVNAVPIDPDAGYLALAGGPETLLYAAVVLLNPDIHSVLVDSMVPGSNCVLTDCFDGMRQLVNFAVSRKCERFLFAENFSAQPGDLNNAERRDAAVYFCRELGLPCQVIDSGACRDLFAALECDLRKTAVLFPQDDPALRFKKLLKADGRFSPQILGFDDYAGHEEGLETLTTVRVDREAMGRAAVDILRQPPGPRKIILRVPGKLIVRD